MKKFLLICMLLCFSWQALATDEHLPLPEVVAASKLSELTGVALNPLLVGGAMRAWTYWQTPEALRTQLHWTAQPWFWGSLLSIGLLFLLNGTLGRLIPPSAKFMDGVETLEGKLAPLYSAPLMIPIGIQLIQALDSSGLMPLSSAHASTGAASVDALTIMLGSCVALFVLTVVWLSNQAAHTLVLLAPLAALSLSVRMLQWGLLVLLLLASTLHPLLGALFALILIVLCTRLAGWSFRLSVFGTLLAWDICTWRSQHSASPQVLAFSGAALALPVRTLGYATQHTFYYRPWLILPQRQLTLDSSARELVHGLLISQIRNPSGNLLTLPPRYRGSETELQTTLHCLSSRPSTLKGGLQALWKWLRE